MYFNLKYINTKNSMSTGVCGIIRTDINDVEYEVDLSFYFEKKANEFRIGTKMGGNISKYVYDKYEDEREKGGIIFELTDSPLDNYAENLFELDGVDNSENLLYRMKRVENLFESLLNHEHVKQITFEVNYLFTESEKPSSIKLSEFCEKIDDIYHQCEVFVPVIKLEIVL